MPFPLPVTFENGNVTMEMRVLKTGLVWGRSGGRFRCNARNINGIDTKDRSSENL